MLTGVILEFLLNLNGAAHFRRGDFEAQPICVLFTLAFHQPLHVWDFEVAQAETGSRCRRLLIALERIQTFFVSRRWLVVQIELGHRF